MTSALFINRTPSSPEARADFHHQSRGAVPFKFVPHPESGWLVSPAWADDLVGRVLFGQVFHIQEDELSAFLTDSYSYWQERVEADLERGKQLREARSKLGGRRPSSAKSDALANLSLDIDLEL